MPLSVREEAGLGSPPEPFFTNASKCINIIKVRVEYKCSELPQFIGKLCELCDEQEREVERAILNRGKFHLGPQYRHLEVAESKWFAMSHDQRSAAPVLNIQSPEAVAYGNSVAHPSLEDVSTWRVCNELVSVPSTLGLSAAAIEAIARKAVEVFKTEMG